MLATAEMIPVTTEAIAIARYLPAKFARVCDIVLATEKNNAQRKHDPQPLFPRNGAGVEQRPRYCDTAASSAPKIAKRQQ